MPLQICVHVRMHAQDACDFAHARTHTEAHTDARTCGHVCGLHVHGSVLSCIDTILSCHQRISWHAPLVNFVPYAPGLPEAFICWRQIDLTLSSLTRKGCCGLCVCESVCVCVCVCVCHCPSPSVATHTHKPLRLGSGSGFGVGARFSG